MGAGASLDAKYDACTSKYKLELTKDQAEEVESKFKELQGKGTEEAELTEQMEALLKSFVKTIEMPENATYSTIKDITDAAKTVKVNGHLCLGSHAANEGEDLEQGVLAQNGIQWDAGQCDLSGLVISGLRLKCNFLGNIDIVKVVTTLVTLDVSECELESLAGIGDLTSLEELDCSENQLTELPDELSKCLNLTTLSAFKNKLKKLPGDFGNLVKLEEVNFFNNKLANVPPSMKNLASLTDLNLGGNSLKTLPDMSQWIEMQKLSVHQNKLMNNPEFRRVLPTFGYMTKLEFLKMDMNKTLTDLPSFLPLEPCEDTIGGYKNVVKMDNPGGVGLAALEHFEVNGCAIEKIDGKGLHLMTAMKTFNCQNQKGTGLKYPSGHVAVEGEEEVFAKPFDVSGMAAFDTFNIEGNVGVTQLPDGINACKQLRICFFQGTNVASLPDGFDKFEELERVLAPLCCEISDDAKAAITRSCAKERMKNGKMMPGMFKQM